MATQSVATHSVRLWVMTTPLGAPVVPEVNRMSEGSNGPSSEQRRSTRTRSDCVARARNPSHDSAPSGTGPRATTTVSRSGSSTPVAAQHGQVVGPEEVGDGDQQPGPTAEQDVRRLPTLEAGVDGHQHRTRRRQAEQGHHPLGAVGGPHGHPVAGLDAGGHQGGGEGAGLDGQLGVGQPGGAVLDGRERPELGGGGGGDGRDGRPRAADRIVHRATASATFINVARFPPMILATDSSSRPWSSSR